MNINGIEIAVVLAIVLFQTVIFFNTWRRISVLGNTFSESWYFSLAWLWVPRHVLNTKPPEEILSEPQIYVAPLTDAEGGGSIVRVTILAVPEDANQILQRIYFSINGYLLRNANGSPDFNLLKDITERNLDSLEEEIHLTMSLPLYLGLMGTMLGIVIGLFSMSEISLSFTGSVRDDELASGIQVLLGGVKIAMIASFMGLFLTVLNSGWFFRKSKNRLEYQKNVFYLYLQSELLPSMGENMGSTFETLGSNLTRFNESFAGNVNRLSEVFSTNIETLRIQQELISSLEKIDLAEVAQYNVKVLKEIRSSTKEFEKLNQHFVNVNSFVENSATLTDRLTEILKRTDNLQAIADSYVRNMHESEELLAFVSKHLQDLENHRRDTSETVAEVGLRMKSAFGELSEHIHTSTKLLEDFTAHEVDLLKKALADSRTNLSNLEFLEDVKNDLSLFKESAASQSERIRVSVAGLNHAMVETNRTLKSIEAQNAETAMSRLTSSVKRLLGREIQK